MPLLRVLLAAGLSAPVLAGMLSCAGVPSRMGTAEAPAWPYGVTVHERMPYDLRRSPLFRGQWLEADPDGEGAWLETGESRFLARLSFRGSLGSRFLDLGTGTRAETIGFVDRGGEMLLVGALESPHHGRAVVARALLLVDPGSGLLLDAIPLPRSRVARGLAADGRQRRVYLFQEADNGSATIDLVDLYQGTRTERLVVGTMPAGVRRRGLAIGRDGVRLFAVSGGETMRSDFAPRGGEEERGPELVIVETDSLRIRTRIALSPVLVPRAVAYDAARDRVLVLESAGNRSRIALVDAAFGEMRALIELPEGATDLVLSGRYGFCPGPHGIYIIDLDTDSWVSRAAVPFDLTREIAVSADLETALVQFQSAATGGPPGIAAVELRTGSVREVLR